MTGDLLPSIPHDAAPILICCSSRDLIRFAVRLVIPNVRVVDLPDLSILRKRPEFLRNILSPAKYLMVDSKLKAGTVFMVWPFCAHCFFSFALTRLVVEMGFDDPPCNLKSFLTFHTKAENKSSLFLALLDLIVFPLAWLKELGYTLR